MLKKKQKKEKPFRLIKDTKKLPGIDWNVWIVS